MPEELEIIAEKDEKKVSQFLSFAKGYRKTICKMLLFAIFLTLLSVLGAIMLENFRIAFIVISILMLFFSCRFFASVVLMNCLLKNIGKDMNVKRGRVLEYDRETSYVKLNDEKKYILFLDTATGQGADVQLGDPIDVYFFKKLPLGIAFPA